MTTVAVLADPPGPDALPDLVGDLLTETEATELYAAMLADTCETVAASGGDLLVNYRPAEQVEGVDDPEAAVREVIDPVAPDARYEVQVGTSLSARIGNTVTHLLERGGADTVGVLRATAAVCGRQQIDSAAMKLRSSEVVVGPSTGGGVYYAAFAETVDFEDAFASPGVQTLVRRAGDAGLDVDFLPTVPSLGSEDDLRTAVPYLLARRAADDPRVPARTVDRIESLGLRVVDGPSLVRD